MKQEPDRQPPSKLPQSTLGETANPPLGANQRSDTQPASVFRSPRTRVIFGNITYTMSVLTLVSSILSRGISIITTGLEAVILGTLIITGLCLGSIAVYILLRTGRVALNPDRIVEYNRLGFSRTFFYAQIIEIKQGSRADVTWIYYHPMDSHGHIDYKSIRGTKLMPVRRDADLRRELINVTLLQGHSAVHGRSEL